MVLPWKSLFGPFFDFNGPKIRWVCSAEAAAEPSLRVGPPSLGVGIDCRRISNFEILRHCRVVSCGFGDNVAGVASTLDARLSSFLFRVSAIYF